MNRFPLLLSLCIAATALSQAGPAYAGSTAVASPERLVEAVRGHMAALGVTPASFLFEKFNPSETRAAA